MLWLAMPSSSALLVGLAMLLRYTFGQHEAAALLESAVNATLAKGFRTADIVSTGGTTVGTAGMIAALLDSLEQMR